MNFKKFISGISALTIAASAFAGLTITASADAYESPYALGSGEEIYSVIIGSAVTENDTITSVTPENFESWTASWYSNTAFTNSMSVRSSGLSAVDDSKNLYGLNNGIALARGAKAQSDFNLKQPIVDGKVVLRGDITLTQRKESVEIVGEDSSGNDITIFKIFGPEANYGYWTIQNNGNSISQSRNNNQQRGYGITLDYVVVDLATGKVSYKYDGIATNSDNHDDIHIGSYNVSDGTNNLTNIKVTGLRSTNASETSSTTAATFDNVAFYAVRTPEAASVTVNYVDANGISINSEIDDTLYVGDAYTKSGTFTIDGKTYMAKPGWFAMIESTSDTVTVPCEEVKEGIYDFTTAPSTWNGQGSDSNASAGISNGMYRFYTNGTSKNARAVFANAYTSDMLKISFDVISDIDTSKNRSATLSVVDSITNPNQVFSMYAVGNNGLFISVNDGTGATDTSLKTRLDNYSRSTHTIEVSLDKEEGTGNYYSTIYVDGVQKIARTATSASQIGALYHYATYSLSATLIDNYAVTDVMNYIKVNSASNGRVSTVPASAAGDTVEITASPDSGYALSSVTVTDESGTPVTVTDNTFTMPDSTVTVTPVFEVASQDGYIINTTPYAGVSIDGADAVSSGATGTYQFAPGTTGEHTVTITKEGYQTKSETVTPVNGGSYGMALSTNTGVEYYEDFAYVNDTFGVDGASLVTDGNDGSKALSISTNGSAKTISFPTLPNGIDLENKMVEIKVKSVTPKDSGKTQQISFTGLQYNKSGNSKGTYAVTYQNVGGTRYWRTNSANSDAASSSESLQIVHRSVNSRVSTYVNGKYVTEQGGYYGGQLTLTDLSVSDWNNADSTVVIDSIAIYSNAPAHFSLSADDVDTKYMDGDTEKTNSNITSVTYLPGFTASLTLPNPIGDGDKDFLGWTKDNGANYVPAGTTVTAEAATTYIATYVDKPSANLVKNDWIEASEDFTIGTGDDTNVLTNAAGKKMYAYKAELEGNGITYETIKGDLKASDDTTGTPEWNQTVPGSGSFILYLITNKALNLTDSVVYCE